MDDDIQEINEIIKTVKSERIRSVLENELKKMTTENKKLETGKKVKIMKELQPEISLVGSHAPIKINNTNTSTTHIYQPVDKYSWLQSDKSLTMYFELVGVGLVPLENFITDFEKRQFTVKVNNLNNNNYILGIKNLHADLDPSKCKLKRKKDKIIVILHKNKSEEWPDLKVKKQTFTPPNPKENKDDNPMSGLMDMMKNMYEQGDDELKSQMAKSWVESQEKMKKEKMEWE